MQEAVQAETIPLQQIAPIAGFFTFGEYFQAQGSCQLLNSTLTMVALSESGSLPPQDLQTSALQASAAAYTGGVANRYAIVLSRLATLVTTTTNELDAKNRELHEANAALVASQKQADRIFSALAEALPGTVLDGKYRLDERIGTGGFGAVFRGIQLTLNRPIAIKIFRPSPGNDSAEAIERFRLEGVSAARIVHPNAISILDSGISTDGIAYLVMELLNGHSLTDELKEYGKLSLRRCAEIINPVCSALTEAHRLGIIHRDIKPDNVFLHQTPEGEVVKVVDFGIAKLLGEDTGVDRKLTATDSIIGTPVYMAPERIVGGSGDARSDVYSVGVMLYEMLCGQPPFQHTAGGFYNLVLSHLNDSPPPMKSFNSDVSWEVEEAVGGALEKSPERRPTIAEFATRFNQAVEMV
jgi:serine/threonine protein kinase